MAHGTTGLTGDQPGSSDLVLAESAARFATNQVALARVAPPCPASHSVTGRRGWSVGLVGLLQNTCRAALPRSPEGSFHAHPNSISRS